MKRIKSTFLVALSFITVSYCQTTGEKIGAQLLREDFTMFRDSIQKLHPGLYRYADKNELDKKFDSCYRTLDHPLSIPEF